MIALVAIAILAILMVLIVGAWTVGGGETMMTGLVAQAVPGDDLDRLAFWQRACTPIFTFFAMFLFAMARSIWVRGSAS